MDLDELNEELKKLDKEQEKLSEKVNYHESAKKILLKKFINENYSMSDRVNKLIREIKYYYREQNSLEDLWNSLYELYNISFNGIIGGRIETDITINVGISYVDEKKLWINSKGLATRERPWYGSYDEDTLPTRCMDATIAMKIIKKYPNIRKFIKRDDKKEIFDAFHKCLKNWADMPVTDDEFIDYKISTIHTNSNSSHGLSSVDLKIKSFIEIYSGTDMFRLKFTDNKNTWQGIRINLASNFTEEEEFILSQLPDEVLDIMEKRLNSYKKVQKKNSKLYSELRDKISPHILHRLI